MPAHPRPIRFPPLPQRAEPQADRQRRAPEAQALAAATLPPRSLLPLTAVQPASPADRREHRPEPASPAPQAAPATAIPGPIPVPAVLAKGTGRAKVMRPARATTMMVPMVPQREAKAITEAEAGAATDQAAAADRAAAD